MSGIYLSWNFDKESFSEFFGEDVEIFDINNPPDAKDIKLLVFPGGEDVSPRLYQCDESLVNRIHSNFSRDEQESTVFYWAIKNKIPNVLGVCRGIQFLNVQLGGTLYEDLRFYEKNHPGIHPINVEPHRNNPFYPWLDTVNSYHHQAIRQIGAKFYNLSAYFEYKVLGTGPMSIIEIMSWIGDYTKILGLQFHPEYLSDANESKGKILGAINKFFKL